MALIELAGIRRIYTLGTTEVVALAGIDLSVQPGEYLAIMGSSGSGKSTLMNLIGCLDTPSEGTYTLGGTKVQELSDDELAGLRNRQIGFVFQSFNLLPRATALTNVALPLLYAGLSVEERGRRARQALERVGLGDRVDHRPNDLSGGQCQRVAIARALVNEPSLLLADEPTGNLDSATSEEIMAVLDSLNAAGVTILLVTHEEDVAGHAFRRIELKDGRIVFEGPTRRASTKAS